MHRVNIGMDEQIMDVGDSFSCLHFHIERWLRDNAGEENISWFRGFDSMVGYFLEFPDAAHAMQFALTWM